jgi:putative phosphoesterase
MKLAIFGDIHANIAALDVVLSDIASRKPDKTFCLGDLVGYAPFPNEVVGRIKDAGIPTIMGNYDDGTGFDRDDCGCAYREQADKDLGDRSFAWTKRHVTEPNKAFLKSLAKEIRLDADGKRILLVHGSPRRINEYLFEDRPIGSFERLAASSNADAIVFGHTHKPYSKRVAGVLFVNAGSVGKPKDGDPQACYVILDTAGDASVELVRLPYDVAATAMAIREGELPDEFALELETGGRHEPAKTAQP